MATSATDDLVVQLEGSLGLSSLEQGPKLVGGVIAEKMPNRGAVKNILRSAWKDFGEARITWVQDNLFSITVQDEDMATKILNNGPWSVAKQCFSVKRWPMDLAIEEVNVGLVPFWVQIRGVPLNLCTKENIEKLGDKAGDVLEYDCPIQARGYLRVRVLVNTANPLVPGFWLQRVEGKETWVEFQYERLADLCYKCGRIGHLNNGCRFEQTPQGSATYGTWTRARIIREMHDQPKPAMVPTRERRKAGTVRPCTQTFEMERGSYTREEGVITSNQGTDSVRQQSHMGLSQSTRNGTLQQVGNRDTVILAGSDNDQSQPLNLGSGMYNRAPRPALLLGHVHYEGEQATPFGPRREGDPSASHSLEEQNPSASVYGPISQSGLEATRGLTNEACPARVTLHAGAMLTMGLK
ncbi:unnamed protein product [Prunus armeniaca]|uniref:CCHC-type domain-containing protein n=1 Tax=Prunus armeniaca TaxID=36596 RepID=A0A6J5WTG5_PRUAR|nr:unnamed protein product [Prunus armeniaca]